MKQYIIIFTVQWSHPSDTVTYAIVVEDWDENKAMKRVMNFAYGESMEIVACARVQGDGGNGLFKVESEVEPRYYTTGRGWKA